VTRTRLTIRDLLRRLTDFDWSQHVYLPPGELSLESEVVVGEPDELDEDENVPDAAAGLVEGLGIDDLRSIRENARQQGRAPTEEEMLRGLRYFIERDAFIDFTVEAS